MRQASFRKPSQQAGGAVPALQRPAQPVFGLYSSLIERVYKRKVKTKLKNKES